MRKGALMSAKIWHAFEQKYDSSTAGIELRQSIHNVAGVSGESALCY